ncbi:hypothetical protein GCM10010399_75980 [Dactylosporangium fulvum]
MLLVAGLVARYPLKLRRTGAVLLASTPLVDVVLLAVSAADLHAGGTAGQAHALAAAYLGFSVAFGHSMIRWADVRFAHRFAGGPPPHKVPKKGPERVRYEWREWFKALLAWAIACGLLQTAIWWVDDPARTGALRGMEGSLSLVLVVWFVGWPVWVSVAQLLTPNTIGRKQSTSKMKRR